jgi:excisionase family DNA binding protein
MPKTNQRIRIYSALEVANICGVVNQTAINWIRNGYLKAFTTPGGQYRVYGEDLSAFLHKRGMHNSIDALDTMTDAGNSNTVNSGNETILIIDNERDTSDRLKTLIENEFPEFMVLQAYDGFEAGRQLYQSKPGLVFLSTDLPGINIFDLAKKFKEDSALGNPNVIALVNNDAEGFLDASWADAYMPRSLDLERLRETIRDLEKQTRALVIA